MRCFASTSCFPPGLRLECSCGSRRSPWLCWHSAAPAYPADELSRPDPYRAGFPCSSPITFSSARTGVSASTSWPNSAQALSGLISIWPWIEKQPGRYDWTLYDDFVAELRKRGLRPLFILNRPNPLYGKPLRRGGGRQAPTRYHATIHQSPKIAAYARWATAAADRYRQLNPIWELWNEPDQDGFGPPSRTRQPIVALAREACASIKQRVPDAIVTGPGMAQMPTVWRPKNPDAGAAG